MVSHLVNGQIPYVCSHAKYKCNQFTEPSSEGKTNLYLPLYSLLYMFSRVSLKQVTQNKFKVNLKFV